MPLKLEDLQYVLEHHVSVDSSLYRVQLAAARPGTVVVGALKLASPGTLAARFDLAAHAVGYFADAPEAAIYESLARREALSLSLSIIGARQLLTLSPGTYTAKIAYRTLSGTPGAMALDLRCGGAPEPLAQRALDGKVGAETEVALTFTVPPQGCAGQMIAIDGQPQELRNPQEASVHRIDVTRGGQP